MTKAALLERYYERQYKEQLKKAIVLIKRLGMNKEKPLCVSPFSSDEYAPYWMTFCIVKPYNSSYKELHTLVRRLIKGKSMTARQYIIAAKFQEFHINWLERWEFDTGYNTMGSNRLETIWQAHENKLARKDD